MDYLKQNGQVVNLQTKKGENNMPYHYGHGKDKKRKNKPKKSKMGKKKKR